MSNQPGFICKQCEGPAPIGVGYVDDSPGAYEKSAGLNACQCGQSKRANAAQFAPDLYKGERSA